MAINNPSWTHGAADSARDAGRHARDAGRNASAAAEEIAERTARRTQELLDSWTTSARQHGDTVREFARENPLAVVAGAFAIGLLLGALRKRER